MFFRLLLLSFLIVVVSQAQTQKVEILAEKLTREGSVVHAQGSVVLYSDRYIITADEAYYDHESGELELIGDITIMQEGSLFTRSDHVKINMKNDSGNLKPMFAFASASKMWLRCSVAEFDSKQYIAKSSILSSCDVQDPDWKIGFSTGRYARQEQFLHTYNTIFYIADIPVFYLPYFAFSTDRRRRTGLLHPKISYGSNEGLYFMQPIYFAPQVNWDFQINPQIRVDRGVGLHGLFRFVDSPYSLGEISLGGFREKQEYVQSNDLKYDKHYGYRIKYDRSRLFSGHFEDSVEDGLWIDFNYLNNIDYLNTIDNSQKSYDSLVQSSFNYYLKRDLDYLGLYAKYFIDTSKESNDDTVQEIPTLHYHRFTNSILADNIFYSIDYKTTNFTSKDGLKAVTHQVNAPISIHFSFLDDFLHFKFTENFYLAKVDYEKSIKKGGGHVVQNHHRISLHTELVKPYENFFHTIYLGFDYTIPGSSKKSDGFKELEKDRDLDEFDSLLLNTKENISLKLVEFFYNQDGKKLIGHTLRQTILMGGLSEDEYRYKDLSNGIHLYFNNNLTLNNLLNYSHEFSRFSKFQTSINWKVEDYSANFIHTYQKNRDEKIDNYLTFSIDTHFVRNYTLFAGINYDIEHNFFKSWQAGWTMQKKCWDYRLVYREELEPNSSTRGSINKRGIYLTFNLYPLGGVSYDFIQEREQGG